jgi:menaquinol-cytochrome c reductase iron-sulfur subunit
MQTVAEGTSALAPSRRRFFSRIIWGVHGLIGAALGVVGGGAIVGPGLGRRTERWVPAARLDELAPNRPVPVMLRLAREDGYTQVVQRRTVFLIRTSERDVIALDSTCTHLGCLVSWDGDASELVCPCHGGRYSRSGAVTAGPPPAPLARFETRLAEGDVLVRV